MIVRVAPRALILLALLLVACGGETPLNLFVAPTATPAPRALTESELLNLLLTADDVSGEWEAAEPTYEVRMPEGEYRFMCADLPRRSTAAANVDFEADRLGPFLTHTLVLFDTIEEAVAAFSDVRQASAECASWLSEAGVVNTVAPVDFPSLGNETLALQLNSTLQAEIVYVRCDNVMVTVLHLSAGEPDTGLTRQSAELASQRLGC